MKSKHILISDIEKRQQRYRARKCRSQPCIVVVSTDLKIIKNIYISLDDQLWSFSSAINALDFIFQLYFILNLEFPPDCYHIWFFLQKMLFDIHFSKIDKKIPIVTRTINDLNAFRILKSRPT